MSLLALLLSVVGLLSACAGQKTSVSSAAISEYEFFNGFIGHDEPVLQTDLTTTFPSGFQLGIWHSAGLEDNDLNSDFGDEIDYTVGWTGSCKQMKISAGLSYFDIYELGSSTDGVVDVWRPYLVANRDYQIAEAHKLGPVVKLERRTRVHGDANQGFTIRGGVNHSWQIDRDWQFGERLGMVWDTGSVGFESIVLGRYNANLNYSITNSLTWNLIFLQLTTPMSEAKNGQENNATFGTGISFSF